MIVGMIVFLGVGALCLWIGWLLWKKQRISLIHDYHIRAVKAEDVPGYTRLMGIGMLSIGAGCVCTGVLVFGFGQALGWLGFPVGFLVGLVLFHRAQKRYNGGWFS